jgi:hypothetical protein
LKEQTAADPVMLADLGTMSREKYDSWTVVARELEGAALAGFPDKELALAVVRATTIG